MNDDFRICFAFVVPSRLPCSATSKNIKTGSPSSPRPNLVGTVPQGMTFRPCCLDSSRAVFPTFWWGGIWPGASANAILFRFSLPFESHAPSILFRSLFFSRRPSYYRATVSRCIPIPVIAILQFVWIRTTIQYRITPNIVEMSDNKRSGMRLLRDKVQRCTSESRMHSVYNSRRQL